jgi:hypothetical protein
MIEGNQFHWKIFPHAQSEIFAAQCHVGAGLGGAQPRNSVPNWKC